LPKKKEEPSFILKTRKQQEYFNFINSLNAEHTKERYAYCLEQFLIYCKLDLHSFLKLQQHQITNLITKYLVEKKVSKQYRNLIFAVLKHACEMNDIILNWKKIKKFTTTSKKTGNEIAGKDRGYFHEEIQKILEFSDQQIKTCFLILASTGIRYEALPSLKYGDLERVQDLYRVTAYSDDQDDKYVTFTTPEAAKEIDAYLEFRKRRGENITNDSYVIVKKFSSNEKSQPYKGYSLRSVLQDNIENTGVRQLGSKFKRKEVPLLHGFRKFFTAQLVKSGVTTELRWKLEGHGLLKNDPAYVRTTEEDLLKEYYKAVLLLTISNEERLKFKLAERITIEKTRIESLQEQMDALKADMAAMNKRKKKS
jgi:Phage integrase family